MFSLSIWDTCNQLQVLPSTQAYEAAQLGLTLAWVVTANDKEVQIFELPLCADPRVFFVTEKIIKICCNSSMALFLAKQNIWLIGRDEQKAGLFGKDDLFESETPFQLNGLSKNFYFEASLYETHAAVICEDGLLYTWGSASNGELGQVGLSWSSGRVVDESSFFKARLVITGPGFTAIVTEGGFLYTYAKQKQCVCQTSFPANSYPFPLLSLEDHFITEAVAYRQGIAVLTSLGKVFLTYNCQCVRQLRTNKNVVQIAANSDKVVALASDKSRMYVWSETEVIKEEKSAEDQANDDQMNHECLDEGNQANSYDLSFFNESQTFQCEVLEIAKGKICSLFNSSTGFLGLCSMNQLVLNEYDEISSPDLSPKYCQQDREKLEELLEKYNFSSSVSHEILNKEEACRTLSHLLSKYLAESFRKVKEAGYLKKLMHRAYAKSCIPAILLKVVNRVNLLHKAWSFSCLGKPSQDQLKLNKSVKAAVLADSLKKISRGRIRSFFLKLHKTANFEAFQKTAASGLCHLSRLISKFFEILIKNPENFSDLVLKLLKLKEKSLKSSSFRLWKHAKKPHLFQSVLSKLLKSRFQSIFGFLLLPYCKNSLKFGFFFLSASISKLVSKQKSYSFNSILRHKPRLASLEDFSIFVFQLYRPLLSESFHKIRVESITRKHKKIIRLIFAGQSLFEKVKYRKVIKGFNAFKRNLLSKSILSDLSSEQSFKKAYQIFTSSKFETPSNEMTMPNTERSTLETSILSSGRKGSGQTQHPKKHSSTDVRTSFMNKSKVPEKTKVKKCGLDKRLAYHETLKERQKKKIMQKGQIIHKSNKSLSALSFNVEEFDKDAWVKKKYLNGGKALEGLLRNIVSGKLRLPFNLLKYCLAGRTRAKELKEKTERKDLQILTRNLQVPGSPCKEYYSPIESPIAFNEDTYTLPPTPFVEMLSPKNLQEISVWKVKLFALGLNKFSRTVRLLNYRPVWSCLKASVLNNRID